MFGRKGRRDRTRLFFATDLHGSDRCFRKWLNAAEVYEVDCLLLGGDVTGKVMIPFEEGSDGWHATLNDDELVARDEEELTELREKVRARGFYDVLLSPEDVSRLDSDPDFHSALFTRAMRETLTRWLELADERVPQTKAEAYFILGNDDAEDLLEGTPHSDSLVYAEPRIQELPGGLEMLSCGYSTPTPWNTPREVSDPELGEKIERLAAQLTNPERAIYNVHCPPRDTHLDQAPMLDDDLRPKVGAGGLMMMSVGSSSVRTVIEARAPLLGLHGHVHESTGVQKLGETLCVNPGSDYQHGILRSALIDVTPDGIGQWQLLQG